jgi:hypothetical protein
MSGRGSGTRPILDCIKLEGIATKRGQKISRGDADDENGDNGLGDGFWRSNANVVLPV